MDRNTEIQSQMLAIAVALCTLATGMYVEQARHHQTTAPLSLNQFHTQLCKLRETYGKALRSQEKPSRWLCVSACVCVCVRVCVCVCARACQDGNIVTEARSS